MQMPTARHPRSILAALAVGTTIVSALATAAPASAQTAVGYVALGDSYSSGVGAGSYVGSSGSCDRSTNAYSQLWAKSNAPASYAFVACAGATTTSVITGQLSSLSSATTLVSITVGGNDVGFASVMETCVLSLTSTCVSAIDTAESKMSSQLPSELNAVLADIRARAPNARVVLLGYPELYDLSRSAICIGLSTTDRKDLNAAADELDGQLRAAASRNGDVFGDVRASFAGHEICDSSSWLHAVNFLDVGESYHPTAAGQADGYEPVLAAAAG
jgi:lysophospholipase L1-like esterase